MKDAFPLVLTPECFLKPIMWVKAAKLCDFRVIYFHSVKQPRCIKVVVLVWELLSHGLN